MLTLVAELPGGHVKVLVGQTADLGSVVGVAPRISLGPHSGQIGADCSEGSDAARNRESWGWER